MQHFCVQQLLFGSGTGAWHATHNSLPSVPPWPPLLSLSACLSLVFILSSASQKRKIYSWSFWLKNLQHLLLLLLLLLAEGKILKILPNPKPCLIQYIFKKSPLQLWLFSPAVLLLIRKALLLFCRRRNLYKWSGHHASVSCSVPSFTHWPGTLTWTQEGHFLTVYTNRMRPQRSALTKIFFHH